MSKHYWEPWEYRLWLAATELTTSSPATRGIWADWISTMMEHHTWFVRGDLDTLAKMGRCTKNEVILALKEIAVNAIGDIEVEGLTGNVTQFITGISRACHEKITVISRKRRSELKVKETNRLRQRRFRERVRNNDDITANSKNHNNKVAKATLYKKYSATRLNDLFELTTEMVAWAKAECPEVDVTNETAKFRDYYAAAAGQKGVRCDWPATWRNWIRNARDRFGGKFDGKIKKAIEQTNPRSTAETLERIGARHRE